MSARETSDKAEEGCYLCEKEAYTTKICSKCMESTKEFMGERIPVIKTRTEVTKLIEDLEDFKAFVNNRLDEILERQAEIRRMILDLHPSDGFQTEEWED